MVLIHQFIIRKEEQNLFLQYRWGERVRDSAQMALDGVTAEALERSTRRASLVEVAMLEPGREDSSAS